MFQPAEAASEVSASQGVPEQALPQASLWTQDAQAAQEDHKRAVGSSVRMSCERA